MANEYRYGQKGVSTDLQFGKRGPRLVANVNTNALQVTLADGQTLSNMRIANANVASDAVTKAQLDAAVSDVSTNAFNITLGNIDADGDGDWIITPDRGDYAGNTSVKRQGAITLQNNTSVAESIDVLNETMWNIQNNTYVRDISFTTNVTQGANPLSATLTISVTGNANRYDIDWGDGTSTTGTSDSTPSHTYTDNTNSPYDITVTAYHADGAGSGSSASHTEENFITLYTATPVANFDLYSVSSGGSALTGNNRYIAEGDTVYLENTTTNSSSATCTYEINWGDGSANTSVSSGGTGDVGQARASHTYSNDSGSSTYTITMQQTAHSTADPNDVGSTTTDILKVYDNTISSPNVLSSKTISFGESSSGDSPRAASGFTDGTVDGNITAGSSVTRLTTSSAGSTTETSTLSSYAFDADSGELFAYLDGNTIIGNVTLASGDQAGTYSRTGAFNGLVLTDEEDFQFLNSSGSSIGFTSTVYHPGLYTGYKAKAYMTTSLVSVGAHTMKLVHSTGGNTNTVEWILDDVTSTPTVSVANVSLVENSAGTLRYVSGIPYYTNDATLTLGNLAVYNWIGQTYTNSTDIVTVANGTNQESTSGATINTQSYTYSDVDGAVTFLSGGIPLANTGKQLANAYTLGDLSVSVNGGGIGIEQINVRSRNVNGAGSYTAIAGKYIQAWNGNTGINEQAISVADDLGAGFDDDGVRITGFGSAADTPAFDNSVNNYTANVWSGAETIAGTVEAVDRWGKITHFDTDLSSTAYLPQGPDLNTGRSGAQYFTFAFRRTTMSNFNIRLTGTISGCWIAAPGTDIDNASGLNGWLDTSTTYGGSGTPGSNTGSGGNGSDGCAFTSGDRIPTGSAISNTAYTMTLGDQNASNATGNNILVRIKLGSGDSLTGLSIE